MKYLLLALAVTLSACCPQKGDTGERGVPGQTVVGPQGPAGSNGSNGTNGTDGLPGAPGSPGLDATPVTVVNLCPGSTSYPGVFIEIALCINNRLQAVYSVNGGFLTYLPPGNYSSNAVGSSCNFTVVSGCDVAY